MEISLVDPLQFYIKHKKSLCFDTKSTAGLRSSFQYPHGLQIEKNEQKTKSELVLVSEAIS